MTEQNHTQKSEPSKPKKLSIWQVIASVFSAAFGVQKSKNRERDFSHGKLSTFVIVGVFFTLLFVLLIVGIVNIVLYLVR